MSMNKKSLSERDICTRFITPALRKTGWDEIHQIMKPAFPGKAYAERDGLNGWLYDIGKIIVNRRKHR